MSERVRTRSVWMVVTPYGADLHTVSLDNAGELAALKLNEKATPYPVQWVRDEFDVLAPDEARAFRERAGVARAECDALFCEKMRRMRSAAAQG